MLAACCRRGHFAGEPIFNGSYWSKEGYKGIITMVVWSDKEARISLALLSHCTSWCQVCFSLASKGNGSHYTEVSNVK